MPVRALITPVQQKSPLQRYRKTLQQEQRFDYGFGVEVVVEVSVSVSAGVEISVSSVSIAGDGASDGEVPIVVFVFVVVVPVAGVGFTIVVLVSVFVPGDAAVGATVSVLCSQAARSAALARMQIYFFIIRMGWAQFGLKLNRTDGGVWPCPSGSARQLASRRCLQRRFVG